MAKDKPESSDFFDQFPSFPDTKQQSSKVKLELKTGENKTGRKRDFGDLPTKRVFHVLPIDTHKAFQQALPETGLKPNQLLNEMIWEYLLQHGYATERPDTNYDE